MHQSSLWRCHTGTCSIKTVISSSREGPKVVLANVHELSRPDQHLKLIKAGIIMSTDFLSGFRAIKNWEAASLQGPEAEGYCPPSLCNTPSVYARFAQLCKSNDFKAHPPPPEGVWIYCWTLLTTFFFVLWQPFWPGPQGPEHPHIWFQPCPKILPGPQSKVLCPPSPKSISGGILRVQTIVHDAPETLQNACGLAPALSGQQGWRLSPWGI